MTKVIEVGETVFIQLLYIWTVCTLDAYLYPSCKVCNGKTIGVGVLECQHKTQVICSTGIVFISSSTVAEFFQA